MSESGWTFSGLKRAIEGENLKVPNLTLSATCVVAKSNFGRAVAIRITVQFPMSAKNF